MAGFSREVAKRVFASELRNSNLALRAVDDQDKYAPQYILTPTGAKCNRIFLAGTLTERDDIGGDTEYWRGRVVDPTGSILIYAGQYQPEAAHILAGIELPAFVAVVGKPSLYETEDGSVLISIRAESIQKVDETTRDRWILDAARHTLDRVRALESAGPVPGPEFATAAEAPRDASMDLDKARMHYNTDPKQYRQMVVRALVSLREDLSQNGAGAARSDLAEPAQAVTEPPAARAAKPEPVQDTVAQAAEAKRRPEARKPVKSKTDKSSIKAWADGDDDVETLNFGKKA
ncbi:MAG TPA: hypothetical protein VN455_08575 [Methanotrichaceae archaeon]|nr:hypothetical protein [Methanotrichaceae archaeon]